MLLCLGRGSVPADSRLSDPALSCLFLLAVGAPGAPGARWPYRGNALQLWAATALSETECSAAAKPALFGSVPLQGGTWKDCSERLWLWSWCVAVGVGTGGCLAGLLQLISAVWVQERCPELGLGAGLSSCVWELSVAASACWALPVQSRNMFLCCDLEWFQS